MARLLLEYGVVWYSPDARFRDLVRYKNLHYLTDLRDQNVIILYPHFVGFEMCVFRLNQDVPLVSVYSNQKNELLDRKIYEGRQRYGNCKIISRREGLRSIIKAMKDHTPLTMTLPRNRPALARWTILSVLLTPPAPRGSAAS